jgi:uncharacterized protein YndB with AHSA1/START domain
MKRDIQVKWFFPHPVEEVWECLTNSELISNWLMKNDFKPMVGHHFQFHSKPLPKMGWDGIVYCEVLEVIPNKRLVYTWKGGPKPGVIRLDTLLTWTITSVNGGTEMVLEHTGFRGMKNIISSIFMENGWKKGIARRFGQLLNTQSHEQA